MWYSFYMHERSYEKLVAWKESYGLCLMIYKITKKFPSDERFGLISQMRRSASSVPINIAEGNSKYSSKEKAHFFEIALCSLEELHCESRLSKDLNYITPEEYVEIDDGVNRISFLINKLRSSVLAPSS